MLLRGPEKKFVIVIPRELHRRDAEPTTALNN
jgi:hypothetical protein